MRAVIQRVNSAKVLVDQEIVGEISKGLLVYVGISHKDTLSDIKYITDKVLNLRIFKDSQQQMNISALDIHAEILVVSQFTLYANCRKGRRPNFKDAAAPEAARSSYEDLINHLTYSGLRVQCGKFQSHMNVISDNDGPITITIDSEKKD